ncbi:MAG: Holliday junction branch migration DNA helicase RuvB [Verrucomicrobiaceae bacterium]|nr:MAG: Holliday junction branch migration DNA helicase RuvB [Verrucomicrobiaceae bacterium]
MSLPDPKSPEPEAIDAAFEVSLRPPLFEEFSGQEKTVARLRLMVEAARQRGDTLQHILLSGPPGLGKTTLAYIIGNAMGSEVRTTSGPMIEKAGDLAGLLTNIERGGILFIDEIHRLQPAIEEYLYPAMEDFKLDIVIDQGPSARSVRLNLAHFTLIGATTRAGMISEPLRSRFGMNCRLDYYPAGQLATIVSRSAGLIGSGIDEDASQEIARRSRGTPRIANNLLRWVRDFAQVRADGKMSAEIAASALTMLEIDEEGFDEMDKRILESLIGLFDGGPVGVNSLAVAIGEEPGTIEEVHEPYLIMQGFLKRTPQGRVAMPKAYRKLGLTEPKKTAQQDLL